MLESNKFPVDRYGNPLDFQEQKLLFPEIKQKNASRTLKEAIVRTSFSYLSHISYAIQRIRVFLQSKRIK